MSIESKVTKAAKKEEAFMAVYKESGGTVPGMFSSSIDKVIFSGVYVGYLLGTVGAEEANKIYSKIKYG